MSSAADTTNAAIPAPASIHAATAASNCLNCGTSLTGKYCAECGQGRGEHSRSVLGIVHEFVEHHILFDTKTLRTAYTLIFRPGHLSRAYLEGKRARYVSPFRLYLFMSLVFFVALFFSGLAVFQVTGRIDVPDFERDHAGSASAEGQRDVGARLADVIAEARRASAWADAASPADRQATIGVARFFAPVEEGGLEVGDRIKAAIDQGGPDETSRSKRAEQGLLMVLQHPRMLNAVLNEWLSRLLILLLPFVALWLALFARRRGLFYVDNLVFALHGQAFAFLLGTLAISIRLWLPTVPIMIPLAAAALVWTLFAYRHVYRSGWIGTVLKVGVIGAVYAVALSAGLLLATVWGLSDIPG
jgi:hypothetical protein